MKKQMRQSGMALIEVMIAVIILGVGVLGAIGLQARSLSALSNAGARVDATIAAEKAIGLMWTDQANLANYVFNSTGGPAPAELTAWMTDLQAVLPNATAAIAVTPIAGSTASQISVTLTWKRRTGVTADKNADQLNNLTIVATVAPTS